MSNEVECYKGTVSCCDVVLHVCVCCVKVCVVCVVRGVLLEVFVFVTYRTVLQIVLL